MEKRDKISVDNIVNFTYKRTSVDSLKIKKILT